MINKSICNFRFRWSSQIQREIHCHM